MKCLWYFPGESYSGSDVVDDENAKPELQPGTWRLDKSIAKNRGEFWRHKLEIIKSWIGVVNTV